MAVRSESVRLSLEDNFTTGMAKAAAATAVLSKNLHDLDGTNVSTTKSTKTLGDETETTGEKTTGATKATKDYTLAMAMADERSARLKKSLRDQAKAQLDAADGAAVFTKEVGGGSREIDRFSGRLALIRDSLITIGPAFAPITAALVPALAGLSAQLGATAGAVGVAVLAFNGIGDALGAVNDYQLEPTQDNLEKLNEELTKIGPAGADFVMFLDSIGPQLSQIQDVARAGLLPGVQEGIESLLTMGPQVERIVANIATAMGEMAASAGEALASDRYADFFNYIENTAGPTLMEMGRTLGNVTEGLANMMVAFAPAANDFTGGLERMTASFAEWSRGLESNETFANFLDYLRESGPQVVALLGSIVNALVGLGQAAAPVGAVVVPALTALANAFAAIAGSPIGAPLIAAAAAFVVLNRAMKGYSAISNSAVAGLMGFGKQADATKSKMTGLNKAMVGLVVFESAILGIKALEGAMRDALPTTEQLTSRLLDLRDGTVSNLGEDFDQLGDAIGRLADANALEQVGDGLLKVLTLGQIEGQRKGDARAEIELLDTALTNLVNSGGADVARQAFEDLAAAQGLTAEETEQLMALLPGYTGALAGAENATRLAGDAAKYLGNAEAAQARATREAVAALREKRDAALAAFDAETRYRQALKDAKAQAEKNTAGIAGNSKAALANRDALSQLASAWNDQSAKVRNNTEKYREAKQAFIETAEQMGVTKQRARELANEILAMPKSREIKITADTSNAMAALYQIQQYKIADKIVRVHTVRTSSDGVGFVSGGRAIPRADGGEVPGQRLPYGDKTLILAAPGEEVITNRNGEADRYRADRAAGRIPAYANGGTVAGSRYATSGSALALPDGELREFARATEQSRKGLTAELKMRAKMLDKELEANKSRLDALKSERDSIAASVKARLQSDIFAKSDQNYITLDRPDNWNDLSPEAQRSHLEAEWSVNQAMGYGQSQSPADILRADLERARQMSELVKRLKSNGLNGNALGALLDGGDLAQIQAYAGDRDATREYERLLNQRERVSSSVGAEAGNAAYGRAIREQTAEVRELRKEARDTNKRLERLEELAKKNPKETGAAVGKEVNGAAAAGQRRRS